MLNKSTCCLWYLRCACCIYTHMCPQHIYNIPTLLVCLSRVLVSKLSLDITYLRNTVLVYVIKSYLEYGGAMHILENWCKLIYVACMSLFVSCCIPSLCIDCDTSHCSEFIGPLVRTLIVPLLSRFPLHLFGFKSS